MKTILIVDDSVVSRRILKNMFEVAGYLVVGEAINGKDGYDQYVKLSPDVVTMDVTMPEMNGLDSIRLIKKYNPEAKIIVISAAGQNEMIEEAKSLGVDEFVTKPYDKEIIVAALNRC